MKNMSSLMLALSLAFVGTLGLVASGCACKHQPVHHAGNQAGPCGCRSGCKGNCKRGYHGRKGGCKGGCAGKAGRLGTHARHAKMMRAKMMRKIKSMGAPKLLCPAKLKMHAKMLGLSADQVSKTRCPRSRPS